MAALLLENTQDLRLQLIRQTLMRAILLAFFMGMMDVALAAPPGMVVLVVGGRPESGLWDDLFVRSRSCGVGIRNVGGAYTSSC